MYIRKKMKEKQWINKEKYMTLSVYIKNIKENERNNRKTNRYYRKNWNILSARLYLYDNH